MVLAILAAQVGLGLTVIGSIQAVMTWRRRVHFRKEVNARLAPSATSTGHHWLRQLCRNGTETGKALTLTRERERLASLLITAGSPFGLTLDELFGMRALLVAAAFAPTIVLVTLFGLRPLLVMGIPLAYLAPHFWLRFRASTQQFRISMALPDFLDLTATALEAGGSFHAVFGEIAAQFGGPVGEVMHQLHRQIALGAPFNEACNRMTRHNTSTELQTFLRTLKKAHNCGVPLSQGLCQYATDIRTERRHQVRKQAAIIEQRLSLVGFLLIFPACLLLITGLVILNLFQNPTFAWSL